MKKVCFNTLFALLLGLHSGFLKACEDDIFQDEVAWEKNYDESDLSWNSTVFSEESSEESDDDFLIFDSLFLDMNSDVITESNLIDQDLDDSYEFPLLIDLNNEPLSESSDVTLGKRSISELSSASMMNEISETDDTNASGKNYVKVRKESKSQDLRMNNFIRKIRALPGRYRIKDLEKIGSLVKKGLLADEEVKNLSTELGLYAECLEIKSSINRDKYAKSKNSFLLINQGADLSSYTEKQKAQIKEEADRYERKHEYDKLRVKKKIAAEISKANK